MVFWHQDCKEICEQISRVSEECHATQRSQVNQWRDGTVQGITGACYSPGAPGDPFRLQEHKNVAGYCDDADD